MVRKAYSVFLCLYLLPDGICRLAVGITSGPAARCPAQRHAVPQPAEREGAAAGNGGSPSARAEEAQPAIDPRQPAPGGQRCQALSRARHLAAGPDPGGQPGPAAGGRQVRSAARLQVQHLRHVVDPPIHQPFDRRAGAHDPHPGASVRIDLAHPARPAATDPGTGPRADQPRSWRWRSGTCRPRMCRRCCARRPRSSRWTRPCSAGWNMPPKRWTACCARPRSRSRWKGRWATRNPASWVISSKTRTRLRRSTRRRARCCASRSSVRSKGCLERERQVLELRFGLTDGKDHTLEEVSRYFNVTRERIRQIEAKALRKLRHPARSRPLRDYLG